MNPSTDLRSVLRYGAILLALTGLILWFSRPTRQTLPDARNLSTTRLDADRQVVRIRVDSLATLLNAVQRRNTGIFHWSDEGSSLRFRADDEPQFDQIFLGGHTLSAFGKLQNAVISIENEGYGFTAPVREQNGIRAVSLPAHIVHSLQLYHQNQ